jgi:hypothetical protein
MYKHCKQVAVCWVLIAIAIVLGLDLGAVGLHGSLSEGGAGLSPKLCTALHCIVLLCCTALHCTGLHWTALHWTGLHWTALDCTALHCTGLHWAALHCTGLDCTACGGHYHLHQPTHPVVHAHRDS